MTNIGPNAMNAIPLELKSARALLPSIALIAAVLILTACGEKPPAPQTTSPKLFQQDREVLDQAKGVAQTEAKSAEDLKREEEKQAK